MARKQPPEQPKGGTHAPDGSFIRTEDQAKRDAEALRLRSRGMSYRAVAEAMNTTVASAHRMVARALADIPREAGEATVTMELAKLDDYQAAAMRVLEARHYTVSNGRLIYLGDGEPLDDDAPVLAALDRLVRISESRRKLIGADAAQKIDTTATVKYTYEGVNPEEV